jgi:YD repeat-containing protein
MSRTTEFTFDNLGRTIAVTQPDPDGGGSLAAPVTAYGYDPVGNLLTVTDPLSHVTTYAYDNLYRRTSITDALSGVTSFTFDAAGQLLTLTDPVANTTAWFYDDLGRVVEEKNQLDKSRYFQYDAVGNLTQRTDRNGRVIQYVYDGLNRNTDENWFVGETQVRNINFEFDAANQLLSAEDPSANNLFTYDKLGRVTLEVQTLTGFADTITIGQEFDALGNRTRAEINYGTAATLATDYVHDGLSRMTQQTQYDSTTSDIAWKRITFQYNAASQFSQIERFVGNSTTPIAVATSTYEYDGIGRLQELLHFTDTTTWSGYEYEYDYDNTNHLYPNAPQQLTTRKTRLPNA